MTHNERILVGAMRAAQDDLSAALQSDLENGVQWLNGQAYAKFQADYPRLNEWIVKFMGIADSAPAARITHEWLEQNPEYTCGCGLYVHPSRRNPAAIHIADCQFATDSATVSAVEGK